MVIRVFDANIQGDIWLAFSRRSDVGWPMAQILALIALVTLLFAIFGVKRKKAPQAIALTRKAPLEKGL